MAQKNCNGIIAEELLYEDVEETQTPQETRDELLRNFTEKIILNKRNNDRADQDDNSPEEDYSDSDEEFYYGEGGSLNKRPTNASSALNTANTNQANRSQPSSKLIGKYLNKINIEKYSGPPLESHVSNTLIETEKKLDNTRIRIKDKQDRATVEQVLDPRTKMILFKMLNRRYFDEVNGCISTGKEANVYHATHEDGREFAIKVYKTSILTFKDRDKYVTGEFRFRNGYSRKNPRKMVRTWAEKEMRNLCRMHANGVKVPEPILLRSHVLLMSFIGKNGWAAPKLKDVELTQSRARQLYWDIVVLMWKMHNKCKLVHADLSEYNILYFNGEVYLIDVSQSVEHDHRYSFHFLRKDIANITSFFRKNGVATMSIKDLFYFIVDKSINEENMEECLHALSDKWAERSSNEMTAEEQVDEQVFMEVTIAKTLSEITDFEKEINLSRAGQGDSAYKTVVGLKPDLSVIEQPAILEDKNNERDDGDENKEVNGEDANGEEEEGESEDSEASDSDEESKFVNSARPKHETLDEKKARKKAVKEEQAEKRKDKIKKHIKKRKVKANKKK